MTPVGLFGLGLIGTALAGRLQKAGLPMIGHDPDPARCAAFAAMGGTPAEPSQVWAHAETVLIAVFDTAQVEAVIATAPATCTACVIITSTCDPDLIAALPARAPARMLLVEAPLSGTSAEVAAGSAVFLTGGAPDAIARAAPLLARLERATHIVGPLGHGSRAKLVVNLILGRTAPPRPKGWALPKALACHQKRCCGWRPTRRQPLPSWRRKARRWWRAISAPRGASRNRPRISG